MEHQINGHDVPAPELRIMELDTQQIADMAGVSRWTVCKAVSKGLLRPTKPHQERHRIRVAYLDARAWIAQLEAERQRIQQKREQATARKAARRPAAVAMQPTLLEAAPVVDNSGVLADVLAELRQQTALLFRLVAGWEGGAK